MEGARFGNASLCTFNNTRFRKAEFESCTFENCTIIDFNLDKIDFDETIFKRCQLKKVSLIVAYFNCCEFIESDFEVHMQQS